LAGDGGRASETLDRWQAGAYISRITGNDHPGVGD